MRLTFHGAAGEVTGSSLVVEAGDARFLVDYGMFQGGREAPRKNREAYQRDLGRLDFVLLTHAHIDHCGLLPRFAATDRRGPQIYCTKPTADLVPGHAQGQRAHPDRAATASARAGAARMQRKSRRCMWPKTSTAWRCA